MTEGDGVSAATTLAIILGAAEWPNWPLLNLSGGAAYSNSAASFHEYVSTQFGLDAANILNLFDDDGSPADIDGKISDFLHTRTERLKRVDTPPRDLIFYYVGHGGFLKDDYYLTLRTTCEGREGSTALRMEDLARTILREARTLRRYLILDCCFAAAAVPEFMGAGALVEVAKRRTMAEFLPAKGTALLCAAGARDPARAPKDGLFTVFSDAMLSVLRTGKKNDEARLSLKDIGDETLAYVRESWPDELTRPQVVSPDVSEGDIALIGLFPNAAMLPRDVRFDALNDLVADLKRTVRSLEAKVAALETERDAAPAAAPPPSFTPDQKPSPPEEAETAVTGRKVAGYFYLTEAQWNSIPLDVRFWLLDCRRADRLGWFWLALAAVLFAGVVALIIAKTPAAAWVWSAVVVLLTSVVLTVTGFIRNWLQDRRGERDAPESLDKSLQPWHNLAPITTYARHKAFRVVGGLNIASPFFEIVAVIVVALLAVVGYLVYAMLTPKA